MHNDEMFIQLLSKQKKKLTPPFTADISVHDVNNMK